MKTNGCSVTFESCDAAFVKKFGPAAAENMVLDFHAVHPALPFLYDASQLADFLSVSCGALNHLVNHIQDAYHPVMIPKHSGGFRHLHIPNARLLACQKQINRNFLSHFPVSTFATAYRKGGSALRNAEPHVGRKYLLKLDITDFFGSISFEQVLCSAFNTCYVSKQVGYLDFSVLQK